MAELGAPKEGTRPKNDILRVDFTGIGKLAFSKRFEVLHILSYIYTFFFFFNFTPCKANQPLRGMELQERKHTEDYRIQKICLERTCS